MKAFEARKASIEPQYEEAMKDIKQAIGWGSKSTHVCNGQALYPEVAERIAKEGYDVKIVLRADDFMSYNKVSWEHAEEGKEGTLTYVDETNSKMPSSLEILKEIFEMGESTSLEEDEENSEEKDEETKSENNSEAKN